MNTSERLAQQLAEPDRAESDLQRFRSVLSGSTLLMILLSWPLWVGSPDFPRIPFVKFDLEGPPWLILTRTGVLISALGLTTLGFFPRIFSSLAGVLLTWAILNDQERFQPWAYQFLLSILATNGLPARRGLQFSGWIIVAIYLFSGLSKLDLSFTKELGPTFLFALVQPFGINPTNWSERVRLSAILAMPLAEMLTGLLLLGRTTRYLGLVGATALHLGLIFILGPWNLSHSSIVLIWNMAILVETWILFLHPARTPSVPSPSLPARFVETVLRLCLIAPILEPFGLIDPWPSHALYSSHIERVVIEVGEEALDRLPIAVQKAARALPDSGWSRIDLTSWSRSVRGVPVYPGCRANLAIGEWIAMNAEPSGPVRVILFGRANRWTGERSRLEFFGLDAIRRRRQDEPLNTQPVTIAPSD